MTACEEMEAQLVIIESDEEQVHLGEGPRLAADHSSAAEVMLGKAAAG